MAVMFLGIRITARVFLSLAKRNRGGVNQRLPPWRDNIPIYEYECENGHRVEEWHRIEDRYNAFCPICSSPCELRISAGNFQFRGMLQVVTHDGRVIDKRPLKNPLPDK